MTTTPEQDYRAQREAERRAAAKRAEDEAFTRLMAALEEAEPLRFTDVAAVREPGHRDGWTPRHVRDRVTGLALWPVRVGVDYFSSGKIAWNTSQHSRQHALGAEKPNAKKIIARLNEEAEAVKARAAEKERAKSAEAQAARNGPALAAALALLFPGKAISVKATHGTADYFDVRVGKATKMRNAGTREEPNWVYDPVVGLTTEYVHETVVEFHTHARADEAGNLTYLTLREVKIRVAVEGSDPEDNLARLAVLASVAAG